MKRLGKAGRGEMSPRMNKEKCLLGRTKHKSKVYHTIQGDLLGSSIDNDLHRKHTRWMGIQKYLKEKLLPPH